jgi:predicted O-linked N-acetylglucosamine transferase (SPINDLY family)
MRIAYLSADFHRHPTAYLMAELFERHDRSRFEVIGVSFGVDDKSDMRRRLVAAFDQFYDVHRKSNEEVAKLLHDLQVDISIDLKGHTQGSRPGILAYRPAPIQVSYLGFSGTMGAEFHRLHYRRRDRSAVRPPAVLCREDRSPAGLLSGQRYQARHRRTDPNTTGSRASGESLCVLLL